MFTDENQERERDAFVEALDMWRRANPDRQRVLPSSTRLIMFLLERLDELEKTFDMRHAADMRGVALWRRSGPDREFVMPDHADLVCFLLSHLEEAEGVAIKQEERAEKAEAMNRVYQEDKWRE